MPLQTYRKFTAMVQEARESLTAKMQEPGGEVYRKLFSKDLGSLKELADALEKHRSVFFKTLGVHHQELEEPEATGGDGQPAGEPGALFVEQKEDEPGRVVGEFLRLPKGGTIYNPSGDDVFVPEVWVRNLGIEHRDVVSAVPLGTLDRESLLYEFSVAERRGLGGTEDRVAVAGPVYRHGADWFIYSDEEGTVISLKPKEVRALGLREGDTVEVAYPRGNLSQARIAWKYDDVPYQEESRARGRREKAARTENTVDIGDPVLSGKTVLVIGADLYKDSFYRNFTRRGAGFLWESGFQGGEGKNIESKVRASDVVVIVTEMMSHRMPKVEAMCKRHGKPYVYAPSKGSTGAVRESQKVLAKAATATK